MIFTVIVSRIIHMCGKLKSKRVKTRFASLNYPYGDRLLNECLRKIHVGLIKKINIVEEKNSEKKI